MTIFQRCPKNKFMNFFRSLLPQNIPGFLCFNTSNLRLEVVLPCFRQFLEKKQEKSQIWPYFWLILGTFFIHSSVYTIDWADIVHILMATGYLSMCPVSDPKTIGNIVGSKIGTSNWRQFHLEKWAFLAGKLPLLNYITLGYMSGQKVCIY